MKVKVFSAPCDAHNSADRTKINTFEDALDGTIDGTPKYPSRSAP